MCSDSLEGAISIERQSDEKTSQLLASQGFGHVSVFALSLSLKSRWAHTRDQSLLTPCKPTASDQTLLGKAPSFRVLDGAARKRKV